jgi:hypothetical protein
MTDDCHAAGRADHQPDREGTDREEIRPEVAPGGVGRIPVEERGDEAEQDQFGFERDIRHERDEAEGEATEDEHDRVGDMQARGEGDSPGHRREQAEDERELVHRHG